MFSRAWNHIINSPTEEEYISRLRQFTSDYSAYPRCVAYIKATWLQAGRKEALVRAWTNQYPHFGVTVTSRSVCPSSGRKIVYTHL